LSQNLSKNSYTNIISLLMMPNNLISPISESHAIERMQIK